MDVERTLELENPDSVDLDLARATLSSCNFQMLTVTRQRLEARGPGISNSRENPLLGFSLLKIHLQGSTLHASGELGGLAFMKKLLVGLIGGLGIGLGTLFSLVLPDPRVGMLVVGGVVLPWLLIGPWLLNLMRRRTLRALDVLLANLVQGRADGNR